MFTASGGGLQLTDTTVRRTTNQTMSPNIFYAVLAAMLFGISTPIAKWLAGDVPPLLLAGLLYLGSGLGLGLLRSVRDGGFKRSGLLAAQWPWLLGAVLFGGVIAPVALMFGLTITSASSASLLLNLEAVLTAVIAWLVFKENTDHRIILGMMAIVAGGVALAWPNQATSASDWRGPALVALACLCWSIDNNLTRQVASTDALFIAAVKGLIAGCVNSALALSLGASMPPVLITMTSLLVGLLGYGISLVLFVLALRGLGTARTGAYFSTAPFLGAATALLLFGESVSINFWLAAALMGLGVWLHVTEQHDHVHTHEDPQTHELLSHSHAHFPDTEHRHAH